MFQPVFRIQVSCDVDLCQLLAIEITIVFKQCPMGFLCSTPNQIGPSHQQSCQPHRWSPPNRATVPQDMSCWEHRQAGKPQAFFVLTKIQ